MLETQEIFSAPEKRYAFALKNCRIPISERFLKF
jgi:hypothetical protein